MAQPPVPLSALRAFEAAARIAARHQLDESAVEQLSDPIQGDVVEEHRHDD